LGKDWGGFHVISEPKKRGVYNGQGLEKLFGHRWGLLIRWATPNERQNHIT
jgi:hypothetical protein